MMIYPSDSVKHHRKTSSNGAVALSRNLIDAPSAGFSMATVRRYHSLSSALHPRKRLGEIATTQSPQHNFSKQEEEENGRNFVVWKLNAFRA
jgi:hypothetical protein